MSHLLRRVIIAGRLFTCRLTSFPAQYLAFKFYSLSLVGFGLTETADFCSHLSNQLFIDTFKSYNRILSFFLRGRYLKFFWYLKYNVVRIPQRKIKEVPLVGCFITHTYKFKLLY